MILAITKLVAFSVALILLTLTAYILYLLQPEVCQRREELHDKLWELLRKNLQEYSYPAKNVITLMTLASYELGYEIGYGEVYSYLNYLVEAGCVQKIRVEGKAKIGSVAKIRKKADVQEISSNQPIFSLN